jgi:hypothetical protein
MNGPTYKVENICNEMEIILVAYECCCVAAVYPFAGSVRVQPTGAGTMRTGAHPKVENVLAELHLRYVV